MAMACSMFTVSSLQSVTFASLNHHHHSSLDVASLNRKSFPAGFIFGTSSSAYQYEGAAKKYGRGPSIWDTFTQYPDSTKDGSNGDVAIDQYHLYEEDVEIMKDMNLDAYRLSISWPRILPKGKLSGGINQEGIDHYNRLINELQAKGIQPFVTLFHWDLPQALEDEYSGFLKRDIINDFRDYAKLCFKEFGDRVKHWITFNEPLNFSLYGYGDGLLAPGRCSKWVNPSCICGDSGREPYIVSHHLLLAHAAAVEVYKKNYQASQKGVIGITLSSKWYVPYCDDLDKEAAKRALDFDLGWYMEPLTSGNYPESMRSLVGDRLPKFSEQDIKHIVGSFDFIGLNYYTAYYAANEVIPISNGLPNALTDSQVNFTTERNGIPIGPASGGGFLYVYPKGIRELLLYIKEKYNDPLIYITENGINELNDPTLSLEEALLDTYRIDYYYRHLYYVRSAIRDGVKIKGYFAWTLLDNFEWNSGYTVRFGLNFVDFNDLKRYQKLSAKWFKDFLKKC